MSFHPSNALTVIAYLVLAVNSSIGIAYIPPLSNLNSLAKKIATGSFLHGHQRRDRCLHLQPSSARFSTLILAATKSNDSDDTLSSSKILALPSIGTSSFWDQPPTTDCNEANRENLPSNSIVLQEPAVVSRKFRIQYTCKICSTRNSHAVTRLTYRKGVVIAMCKGCESRHWIADNLGWSNYDDGFDFDNGETNIEQYMINKNKVRIKVSDSDSCVPEEVDLVMRVEKNVFDLENVLYTDQGVREGSSKVLDDGREHWS